MIIAAAMGDPNASIPTPQPVHYRPMFAAFGGARAETCVTFVSGRALAEGIKERLGLRKRLVAVRGTRTIGKADLRLNDYLPRIDVDAQTYQVRADGQLLTCDPAEVLPLAQRISCFDGGARQDQQMLGTPEVCAPLNSSFQGKGQKSC